MTRDTKARRIVPVVNPNAVRETLKPVTLTRTELRVGIPVEVEKKLRRLQGLLGGSLEDVLEKAIHETLERHDPVAKVERAFLRKRQAAWACDQVVLGPLPLPVSSRGQPQQKSGNGIGP